MNKQHIGFVDAPFLPESKEEATIFLSNVIQRKRRSFVLPKEHGIDFILDHKNADFLRKLAEQSRAVASDLLWKLNWEQPLKHLSQ